MRQLFYAMQFKGQAGGDKEGTMVAKTTSGSCRVTSTVNEAGLEAMIEPVAGGSASFESEVTLTGESSFLESGSIHFGHRNSPGSVAGRPPRTGPLRFSTGAKV